MLVFNSESSISHSFSHAKFIPTEILNQIVIVDFQLGSDLNDAQINPTSRFSCFFLSEFYSHSCKIHCSSAFSAKKAEI